MAMQFMDGFDLGDCVAKWNVTNGITVQSPGRFGTGRFILLQGGSYATKLITPSAQVFVGFAYTTNGFASADGEFMTLSGDTGTVEHLKLRWTSTTTIGLYRGTTQIANVPLTMPLTTASWVYLEISATIDSTVGTCVVRANGVQIINFTGNTRNGGTSTNIDGVTLCRRGSYNTIFDDFYVCDVTGTAPYNTFLGELRIHALSPTAAGATTQWTPGAGSNYAQVNETPYSAANYVQSGTVGQRDTYAMADLPASVGNVLAVQNNVVAKRTDASAVSLKPAIVSGASVYYGASTALTTSDATVTDLRTTDPNTAVSWTASGVNALEGGFEVA